MPSSFERFALNKNFINTIAEYEASPERLSGHTAGLAKAELQNRVLYDNSLAVKALMDFIDDNQLVTITQDLTEAQIQAAFIEAIKSIVEFGTYVDLTNPQTITAIKDFTSSPLVPVPTTATQAANKQYVDDTLVSAAGQFVTLTTPQTITGNKIFAGDLNYTGLSGQFDWFDPLKQDRVITHDQLKEIGGYRASRVRGLSDENVTVTSDYFGELLRLTRQTTAMTVTLPVIDAATYAEGLEILNSTPFDATILPPAGFTQGFIAGNLASTPSYLLPAGATVRLMNTGDGNYLVLDAGGGFVASDFESLGTNTFGLQRFGSSGWKKVWGVFPTFTGSGGINGNPYTLTGNAVFYEAFVSKPHVVLTEAASTTNTALNSRNFLTLNVPSTNNVQTTANIFNAGGNTSTAVNYVAIGI
jgi:hypothetical protein